MFSRVLLACLICLMMYHPAQAEPTLYFRGKRLTYRHFIYGEVTSSAQRAGTINLGYAHGLQEGQEVGVLRRSEGRLLPTGVLRLVKVQSADSFGEYEGNFTLMKNDLIVVSARNLTLWQGRTRSNQLVIDSMLSRNGQGYDTGDVSPSILDEVGRDDDLAHRKPLSLHVNSDLQTIKPPVDRHQIIRGAFRPTAGSDDGVASVLSHDDRLLSPDKPTLALETALAQFVLTNAAGKVDIETRGLRQFADDRPGLEDLSDIRSDFEQANAQIRQLIHPR